MCLDVPAPVSIVNEYPFTEVTLVRLFACMSPKVPSPRVWCSVCLVANVADPLLDIAVPVNVVSKNHRKLKSLGTQVTRV